MMVEDVAVGQMRRCERVEKCEGMKEEMWTVMVGGREDSKEEKD